MFIKKANNMSEIWNHLYRELYENGEVVETRAGRARHLTNVTFTLTNPKDSVIYNDYRVLSDTYLVAELVWYMSGSNTIDFIGKHAKMWNRITDDGKTVNSAYGHLLMEKYGFNQIKHVIKQLKEDPQTRQAVLHFKFPSDKFSKDVPCTLSMQLVVFKGKLNAHTYMRSNDIWFGTPYDVVFFTMLQQMISYYTGIPLGEYHHTVGDLHLYEKNAKKHPDFVNSLSGPEFIWDTYTQSALEDYIVNNQTTVFLPEAVIRLKENANGKDKN